MVIVTRPYNYGADADGRRGVIRQNVYVKSDISGEDLDEDNIYDFFGTLCSYKELLDELKIEHFTPNKDKVICYGCKEIINNGAEAFCYKNHWYDEACLYDILHREYHITEEDAVYLYGPK